MLALAQKTSQVLLHMTVAFGVTYGFTGSLAVGGLAAVVEPICNVLLLPLHDRVWRKLRTRTRMRRQPLQAPGAGGHASHAAAGASAF